jgi:hypothetical protein
VRSARLIVMKKAPRAATAANVRAFLARDWDGARRAKDIALARWSAANGSDGSLRLGQALLEQVWSRLRLDPAFGNDVTGLVALTEKLARANAKHR